MINALAMVLAGGKGTRLHPLTLHRAKSAIPFGGHYRIIDFTLSNCINSAIHRIAVLTQYKSFSLDRHLRMGWWNMFKPEQGEFIISLPPQQRISKGWYRGTADAVYQNLYLMQQENPDYIFILSGDHVYKMNYAEMLAYHQDVKADATIGAIEVSSDAASRFGVIEVDAQGRVANFEEKPPVPQTRPNRADLCYANMGVYLFNRESLSHYLTADADLPTHHDFGKDILPKMVKEACVMAYEFRDENRKATRYWRDIGTPDSYWDAHMDLIAVDPLFNLYDRDWPIRTYRGQDPPAKFVFAQEFKGGRLGIALDSIVCNGCIISGARVQHSVLSPNVRIEDYSIVENSVILENVTIGRHCRIQKAILDKDVHLPEKTEIGYAPESDRMRFVITESGIMVVTKEMLKG